MSGPVLEFDLSGLGVRLTGVPPDVYPWLQEEWAPFARPVSRPHLDLRVEEDARTMPERSTMGERLDAAYSAARAAFVSDEGRAWVDRSGAGGIALARGDAGRRGFCVVGMTAALAGWSVAGAGGAALHAAGVVLEGRAFVLVGPAGSGKSTWARAAREAGGLLLSDDLVLVDGAEPVVLLSTPFRTRPYPTPPPGRWPVAAVLLPVHGPVPALATVSPLEARARVAANVLYVEHAARLAAGGPVERLLGLPVRALTFAPDPGFVPLLLRAFPA